MCIHVCPCLWIWWNELADGCRETTSVHQSSIDCPFFFFFVCEKVPIFFNLWVSYFSEQPYCWLTCNNYMFMYFIGLLWFYHRYANRPVMSVPGLYDPTEVMNASVMSRCQKEGWIKLAFFLLCFFYYLYR